MREIAELVKECASTPWATSSPTGIDHLAPHAAANTIEYVTTTVTTVRMDAETLKALRARAKREGRSVSSLITSILKRSVVDGDGKRSFVGVLMDMPVPELEDFRAVRARLNAAMRTHAKAR